jgi:thioredoxin 1
MSQKRAIYGLRKKSEIEEVIKKHKIIVVKIEATWCGPCQRMKPLFAENVNKLPNSVAVVIIDLDQSPELKRYFRVQAVPLLLNIVDGEVKDITNSGNFEDVNSFFKKTVNRI